MIFYDIFLPRLFFAFWHFFCTSFSPLVPMCRNYWVTGTAKNYCSVTQTHCWFRLYFHHVNGSTNPFHIVQNMFNKKLPDRRAISAQCFFLFMSLSLWVVEGPVGSSVVRRLIATLASILDSKRTLSRHRSIQPIKHL